MDDSIGVADAADGSLRIALRGPVAFGTIDRLRDPLRRVLADAPATAVVLDLDGVTFLDSSGMSLLVLLRRLATESGGSCLVDRASPAVVAHLQMVGLTQLFGLRAVVRRQDAARAGVRPPRAATVAPRRKDAAGSGAAGTGGAWTGEGRGVRGTGAVGH